MPAFVHDDRCAEIVTRISTQAAELYLELLTPLLERYWAMPPSPMAL